MEILDQKIEDLKNSRSEPCRIGAEIAVVAHESLRGLCALMSRPRLSDSERGVSDEERRDLADAVVLQAETEVRKLIDRLFEIRPRLREDETFPPREEKA